MYNNDKPDVTDWDDGWDTNSIDSSWELEQASVIIGLNKTGEPGACYRTRNDPSAPFQRQTATERRGIIEVRCMSREIIHGALSADGEDRATLLVYDLYLDTTRPSRRITSAKLEFQFYSTVLGVRAPEVHRIVPQGRTNLHPTKQDVSVTRSAELNAGVGQFGVDIGGAIKWEKTTRHTTDDDARVVSYVFSDNYGRGIGAGWNLFENKSRKSGVPSFLRCAILLNRGEDGDNAFQCELRIGAKADWKSEMGRLFGSTAGDDPILFDPSLPPTNRLQRSGYDAENLGSVELCAFTNMGFGQDFQLKEDKDREQPQKHHEEE